MNGEEQRFAEICKELNASKKKSDALEAEKKNLAESILTRWMETGFETATVAGMTLYIKKNLYPIMKEDRDVVAERLSAMPRFSWLVKPNFNSNTLRGEMKNYMAENEDQLPQEWEGLIEAGERTSLEARKSSR